MKPETRKAVETEILTWMSAIDASGINTKMYEELFKTMSDETLLKLIEQPVPVYAPPGSKVDINPARNVAFAKTIGHEFYQRIRLTDPRTMATSLTKYEHMVIELPVRRQTQMIDKKISIPEHNRTIDKMTGQPTGDSKGSSFSFPQTYVMFAKGYEATLKELVQIRGGDVKAGQVVDRQIRQSGSSRQEFEGSDRTHSQSSLTLGAIFKAMHLGNNLK